MTGARAIIPANAETATQFQSEENAANPVALKTISTANIAISPA